MRLAFIDLETTGSRSTRDRITEVAIKIWEDGEVVDAWQSLVNPECSIPPFIQSLTGINDTMVSTAPLFHELADTIDSMTQNAVFVAHNARFDYAFMKGEFRRLERPYQRRVLCTVKLAKALYPEFKSHGLDALSKRHHIEISARHRAMGDVDATIAFFEIAQREKGPEAFDAAIAKQLKKPSLPKGLTEAQVNAVPDSPGVYRFYGENRSLLYVGKSVNMYQRVMSHFASDHQSTKEMTIAQSVTDIEWTDTAGDLGAQLLELKQIKTLHPIYNRRSRAAKTLLTLTLSKNKDGYLEVGQSRSLDLDTLDRCYGLYRSQNAAQKALVKIAHHNDLCRKLLGLESGAGPCFGYQTSSCQGACVGEEDAERFNLRMQIAFHELQLKVWPFKGLIGIKERHPSRNWKQIHLVYNWCHLASVDSDEALYEALEESALGGLSFDLDTYKLLSKAILSPKFKLPIIELGKPG